MRDVRKDFPILKKKINGRILAYLDNAATTQKPTKVIKAVTNYYKHTNANVHRGIHKLSEEATEQYENAHDSAAEFIGAKSRGEIVFTKNTTESINIVANSMAQTLRKGDEIVLTQMEHHSNLVPWLMAARNSGARIRYANVKKDGSLNRRQFSALLNKKTKLVAMTHISNVLGSINPIKELAKEAHDAKAIMLVDAAQSVPHMPVDIKKLNCDFLTFSAHKMLGPTGIGILYGKQHLLETTIPLMYGGDMIREVKYTSATWNDLPWKFEAGTPNIAGGIGFAEALTYLKKIGMENIQSHTESLTKYAMQQLAAIDGIATYGPRKRGALVSFNLKGIHPHDVSSILDSEGIAVRGGHHCAMPLMKLLNIPGSVRASFYLYNTKEEIRRMAEAVRKVKRVFA